MCIYILAEPLKDHNGNMGGGGGGGGGSIWELYMCSSVIRDPEHLSIEKK